ncbi:MAG: hypothetical protein AUG51_10405 [Acidobacteria bacterium 13_1_20CM_3_53_8]|nr:MAG: hypothetical protein AUG51_10405 [Acidobacteria bacterium 13_1_20CM_3_53_8]
MSSLPLVSVVMPVHNGEKYVLEAIQSILRQTCKNFEFIIVNDGSDDSTAEILERCKREDGRISIYHQKKLGFTTALNSACKLAKGKYIARMDADDISLPQRFSRQVKFLEAHPAHSLCGTWIKAFSATKNHVISYPTDSEDIKCLLLFECAFAHPSVMMRRKLFEVHGLSYNHSFREASDYSLWVEASKVGALMNIPEVLLFYRVHDSQVSEYDRERQQNLAQQVRIRQLKELGVSAEKDELDLHAEISTGRFVSNKDFVDRSERWLLKLQRANEQKKIYEESIFRSLLSDKWFSVCNAAAGLGLWVSRRYSESQLARKTPLNFSRRLKLLAKCSMKLH